MKLPLPLLKGLSEERKKIVEAQYHSSQTLLKQYRKILQDKLESEYRAEELAEDLAHVFKSLGYRKAIRELIDLLPDGQDNDN